ncbi:four helix bundle protein [Candidatus Roizmanbacteria bacterium]|nr:MAG: four helix bundle protein [Candidatus Roizmanbacteria bacterium]
MSSYKDLIVWKKSINLVTEIYTVTAALPTEEKFGLVSQMRRSAVSIPSNIAEGRRRNSQKEYKQFLAIAYGSGAELETQIEIVKRLPFGSTIEFRNTDFLLLEVMKMLNVMVSRLD